MPTALIMRLNFDALALGFRAKDYKKVRPRYRQRSLTKRIVKKGGCYIWITICGEYRSRTDDLLHAMQAL